MLRSAHPRPELDYHHFGHNTDQMGTVKSTDYSKVMGSLYIVRASTTDFFYIYGPGPGPGVNFFSLYLDRNIDTDNALFSKEI